MKPENKAILDNHLPQFINLERAFYVRGLMAHVRDELDKVMREEFNPHHTYCGSCETDIANNLKMLYRYYHDYLKAFHGDTKVYKDISEGIIEMNKLPIIVHTGFPDNKTTS